MSEVVVPSVVADELVLVLLVPSVVDWVVLVLVVVVASIVDWVELVLVELVPSVVD